MKVRIGAICGASIFKMRLGNPSGPAALDGLSPRSNFSTPGEVMEKLGMVGNAGDDSFSGMVVVSSFVNTDLK